MPVSQQNPPLGAAPTFRTTGTIIGRNVASQMLGRFNYPIVAGSQFAFATLVSVQVVDTVGSGVNLLLRVGINTVTALGGGDPLLPVQVAPTYFNVVSSGVWSMDEGTILTGAPDANSEVDLFMLNAGALDNPASVTRRYPTVIYAAAPGVVHGTGPPATGHAYLFSVLPIPTGRTYELTVTWVIG